MRLTPEELAVHPAPFVKVGVTDLDGVLRTKYLSREKLQAATRAGSGFCNVIFGWDLQDTVYGPPLPDPGFADARITIDLGSGRTLPWENDTPLLLVDLRDDTGPAGKACPRSLLLRTVARARDWGYSRSSALSTSGLPTGKRRPVWSGRTTVTSRRSVRACSATPPYVRVSIPPSGTT